MFQTIHFDSEAALDAALDYLGHLNLVFYYPDILPNVVFVSSQILLDKVTELVKAAYRMIQGETAISMSAVQGELGQRFCDYAIISAEFLKRNSDFQKHYAPNIFMHDDLIVLFRKLLIFADMSSAEYFVPALLKKLKNDELEMYRVKPSSPIAAPLVFLFGKHGGPLIGVFCATVAALLSEDNVGPCHWELKMDKESVPTCLHRNCVQFVIPDHFGFITLIETFEHIEVHVTEIADEDCRMVRESISKALHHATTALHYKFSEPDIGFSCPCGKSAFHLAKITANRQSWMCSEDVCKHGHLNSNQKIWLDPEKKVLTSTSTPKLHQLQQIGVKGQEIKIIKRIAARWEDVALGLSFEHYVIDRDSHFQCEQACHSMFSKWLDGEGRKPITWQTLIKALNEASFTSVAQELQAVIN